MATGRGRLLNSSGKVLDGAKTIRESKLKGGDELILHVKPVQLIATRRSGIFCAFVAILGDGPAVTWGDADCGGDSTAVHEELKNVQQIQASGGAFAAILVDGSVATWGKEKEVRSRRSSRLCS